MKYLLYLPFLFLLGSCQNDSSAATETENATSGVAEADRPKYENAPGLNDPQTAIENGIWVINGYVVTGEQGGQEENVNRWFDFNPNGRYERGRYGEKQGDGTWDYEADTNLLTLVDTDAAFNSQFKVRVTPDGKSMIIIGTNRYNQQRIQGKLVNATDYPTQ